MDKQIMELYTQFMELYLWINLENAGHYQYG